MKQKVEGWKGEGKRALQRERFRRRNGGGKEGARKGGAVLRMIEREVNLEGGVLLSFGESDLEEDLSQDGWCTLAPIPPISNCSLQTMLWGGGESCQICV